jgi:hypothetical protein
LELPVSGVQESDGKHNVLASMDRSAPYLIGIVLVEASVLDLIASYAALKAGSLLHPPTHRLPPLCYGLALNL